MPVTIGRDSVRIGADMRSGMGLALTDLPGLWQWHIESDPLTPLISRGAARFVSAGFPPRRALLLVRVVCAWGGLRGSNPERVLSSCRELGDAKLAQRLADAHALSLEEDFQAAIETLRPIRGMQVSFQSKILRFLCPDHAAVLDSRIVEACGYPARPSGYASFVNDCRTTRAHLNRLGLPRPDGGQWHATDVEMAIFASIKQDPPFKQKQIV